MTMPQANRSATDPRPRPVTTTNARAWLHTAELGLAFLVLAILADAAGTAHDEPSGIVVQRSSMATSKPRAAIAQGSVISVAARPAMRR